MESVVILYYTTVPTPPLNVSPSPALHFSTASLQASFCLSTFSLVVYLFYVRPRRDYSSARSDCRPEPSLTLAKIGYDLQLFQLCCCLLGAFRTDALTPNYSFPQTESISWVVVDKTRREFNISEP